MRGAVRYEDEIYECKNCGKSEYTSEWKCKHCGNYIVITIERNGNIIYFIRKTVYNLEVGDSVMLDSYIYEILGIVANTKKKNKHRPYQIRLSGYGTYIPLDFNYVNCAL